MKYLCLIYVEERKLDAVPADAIRIASNIPSARLGCVEVRPVRG
jgi:hypothetical protein